MFYTVPVPISAVPLDEIVPHDDLVYFASPYTSSSKLLVQFRQMAIEYATAQALKAGWMIYSPIVHCHTIAERYGLPTHAAFWEKYNRAMIDVSRELWLLMLDGYESSAGVKGELAYASERHMPITCVYVLPGTHRLAIEASIPIDIHKGSPRALKVVA